MAQISNYPLSKEVKERILEIFLETIAGLSNPKLIDEFLKDFLSPVEKVMLAKRLSIAVLLGKGYDYREIRKILRVNPSTISTVNLKLRHSGRGYKQVVEKILRQEKMAKFWQKIGEVLTETIPPKGQNWSYWRKEIEAEKKKLQKAF